MGSTRWKGAAGSTTRTFGGWTRATLPHATVPGWGKSWWGQSPSRISTRSPLKHSNEVDTTARHARPFSLLIYLARVAADRTIRCGPAVGVHWLVTSRLVYFADSGR